MQVIIGLAQLTSHFFSLFSTVSIFFHDKEVQSTFRKNTSGVNSTLLAICHLFLTLLRKVCEKCLFHTVCSIKFLVDWLCVPVVTMLNFSEPDATNCVCELGIVTFERLFCSEVVGK